MELVMLLAGIIGVVVLILVVFIFVTEGKYFGKRFLRWVYNLRAGEFEVRDDWDMCLSLIRRLSVGPTDRLLELGTQTGHLPRLVARQPGFQGCAVGVDWSEEMIKEARRQARLEGVSSRTRFLCADVNRPLPFPDDSFTVVVCVTGLLGSLRHPEFLLREIRRVLRPGGLVAFSYTPTLLPPRRLRDPSWFKENLPPLGFTPPRFTRWTSTHHLVLSRLEKKTTGEKTDLGDEHAAA